MKKKAAILYLEGLRNIAAKHGISIPEATLFSIAEVIENKKELEIEDIVAAAKELNPGDTYLRGLWEISDATSVLREAAGQIIDDLGKGLSEEHINPTKRAFTWFTGKEF